MLDSCPKSSEPPAVLERTMRGTIGTLMTSSASRRSMENESVCVRPATGPSFIDPGAPRATSSSPVDGPRSGSPRLVRHRPQQHADEQDDAQPNDAKPDGSGAFLALVPACANEWRRCASIRRVHPPRDTRWCSSQWASAKQQACCQPRRCPFQRPTRRPARRCRVPSDSRAGEEPARQSLI